MWSHNRITSLLHLLPKGILFKCAGRYTDCCKDTRGVYKMKEGDAGDGGINNVNR